MTPGLSPSIDDWFKTYKNLTQINQKWSKVATTSPETFSELDLDIKPSESEKATKLLKLWITKTQYKLHLTIRIGHPLKVRLLIGPLYDTLNNCTKLHTLTLDTINFHVNSHISTLSDTNLPSLQKLTIREHSTEFELHPIISTNAPLKAPKLQDIHLQVFNLKAIHKDNLSKVQRLTLSSNNFRPNTYFEILRECLQLTHCTIDMRNEMVIAQMSKKSKSVQLLKLEHLTITTHKELPPLLDIIHSPNLRVLEIKVAIHALSAKIESIIPFINKMESLEQIIISGHAILDSRNDFELGLKKKTNTHWEETSNRETHRITYCGDSETETNSEYYEGASGPEEIEEEEENDDDYIL